MVDVDRALKEEREIGYVPSLAFVLWAQCWLHVDGGNYGVADRLVDELLGLADDKGVVFWKAGAIVCRGWLFSLTGKALEAVKMTSSGLTALRSAGASLHSPLMLKNLAKAHAQLGQFDDAWRCVGEAIATVQRTREKFYEAEVNRFAGEITLMLPRPVDCKSAGVF